MLSLASDLTLTIKNHSAKAARPQSETVPRYVRLAIGGKEIGLSIKLRKWQIEAKQKAVDWYQSGERLFLAEAAPGAGKTIFAAALAKELIQTGKIERVIAIAPRTQVATQWGEEFTAVTGRPMMRVLSSESGVDGYGLDLCLTWQSVDGLLPSLGRFVL